MNKKLTLKMESKDFSISKKDRPITAGGGTLAIGNGKKLEVKHKQRGTSIAAIKAETSRRKAAYRASSKK